MALSVHFSISVLNHLMEHYKVKPVKFISHYGMKKSFNISIIVLSWGWGGGGVGGGVAGTSKLKVRCLMYLFIAEDHVYEHSHIFW